MDIRTDTSSSSHVFYFTLHIRGDRSRPPGKVNLRNLSPNPFLIVFHLLPSHRYYLFNRLCRLIWFRHLGFLISRLEGSTGPTYKSLEEGFYVITKLRKSILQIGSKHRGGCAPAFFTGDSIMRKLLVFPVILHPTGNIKKLVFWFVWW